ERGGGGEEGGEGGLAVGIERHPRHHRVAHEERDGARRRAGPRGAADRGRERDRLPHPGRVDGRQQGRRRRLGGRGRVHLLGEGLRAAHEGRVAAVDGGDGVAARGREAGRERRPTAGPDGGGPQDHVAVLEGDRAGRRSASRGDGGHPGGEGHGLAGGGRVERRPQGDRGRRGVDGHGRGRRGAGGEAADAEEGGRQRVGADEQRRREGGLDGGVKRRGAEQRVTVAEEDGADWRARLGGHGGRQGLDLPDDGGRGRRAERRRRGHGDGRRGGGHQPTDVAGGGAGRDRGHGGVALQVGRRHAEGGLATGPEPL